MISDWMNLAWFGAVIAALLLLFAAGLKLRPGHAGWRRRTSRVVVVAAAVALTVMANAALYRHDVHLDVTYSQAFTPAPDAQRVLHGLASDVELVYFYQAQNPAGRAAKRMVEVMGRLSPHLHVRTVDPDQHPSVANRYGVRLFNVAVLESGGRRVQVVSTDERDIALGILRVTRALVKTVCFTVGHGEYDIDNLEYHTHFEGFHAHSHGAEGAGVVLTEQHGVGRLRRGLEAVGFATRKVTLATAGRVPDECAALVEVNPRTLYAPVESQALAEYLGRGGAALLLFDLEFPVEPRLAELLATAGIRLGTGVVVDPREHYFTDEQMVAVATYSHHPITRGLALSFFPGARPLDVVQAAPGIAVAPLFSSSGESYVRPVRSGTGPSGGDRALGARVLAAVAEGRWPGSTSAKPFRLVVIGDGDFASNSFFPYMSNSDLALAILAWLLGEERAPVLKPPVEVLPQVVLTNRQVEGIFLFTTVALPAVPVLIGGVVWWRRRR
jgi:hypothetical protein